MKKKSKKWIVKIEAEIENSANDPEELEDKKTFTALIKDGLDLEHFGGTLGSFKTKIKKLSIKLKR